MIICTYILQYDTEQDKIDVYILPVCPNVCTAAGNKKLVNITV